MSLKRSLGTNRAAGLGRYVLQLATAIAVLGLSAPAVIAQGILAQTEEPSGEPALTQEDVRELDRLRQERDIRDTVERSLADSTLLRDRIDAEIEDAMAENRPPITALYVVLALFPLLGAIAVWLVLNRLESRAASYAQELESVKADALSELMTMMSEAQTVLQDIQTQIHEPLPRVPVQSRGETLTLATGEGDRPGAASSSRTATPSADREFPEPPATFDEERLGEERLGEEIAIADRAEPDNQDSTVTGEFAENFDEDTVEDAPNAQAEEIFADEDDRAEDEEETPPPSLRSILDADDDADELDEAEELGNDAEGDRPHDVASILDDDADREAASDETPSRDPLNAADEKDEDHLDNPASELSETAGDRNGHTAPPTVDRARASEFCRQANALFFQGRYAEAIAAYQRAIEFNPEYHQAWSNQGSAYFHQGQFERAIAAYERALAIKDDYPEAWNNKGGALAKLRQHENALVAYNRAVQLKPDYVEAWNNRGLALAELGRYKEAVTSYNRALKQKPEYVEAWNNRGLALAAANRHDQALPCFLKAQKLQPDGGDAYRNQAASLAALEHDDEAIAAYQKATQLQPADLAAWYYFGQLLARLKRYDEAIAAYDRAVTLQPAAADVWYNKACCYSQQGYVAPAIENLQEAMRLAPHAYGDRARAETAFEPIRQDERFKQLFDSAIVE